jgi:hypothetical protein
MAEMPDGKKATFAIEEIFSLRIVGMTAVPNVVLQERSGSWSASVEGLPSRHESFEWDAKRNGTSEGKNWIQKEPTEVHMPFSEL